MGKRVILTDEWATQFNNAMELLNASILEFNQIADQMIPEKLIDSGLPAYLNDFGKYLEKENNIIVYFQYDGDSNRVEEDIEIQLFRCFRILILNILEFSKPTYIHLNLVKSDYSYTLQIRDNGSDIFSNAQNIVKKGTGQVNTILKQCNGLVSLNFEQAGGNEVHVQIPLKK